MPSRFLAVSLSLVSFGCVTYDFEPVEPQLIVVFTENFDVPPVLEKPDLFLVVDKSGSMNFGVPAAGCNCPTGACPPGCPTRWSELKNAVSPFLMNEGSALHVGMVPFPPESANVCTGATTGDIATYGVPLNRSPDTDLAGMQATADTVWSRINGITPQGGTPTATTMNALLNYPTLVDGTSRPHFALLLTDGLPNCNGSSNPATCTCTAAAPCIANNCLDDDPTAAEIAKLKAANVTTIVLGFGTDTNAGLGPATLSKLAAAGGFSRTCMTDSDCGTGDTCSAAATGMRCGMPTRSCLRPYFQAGNTAELASALDAVRTSLQCAPCRFTLSERPKDPRYLTVQVNGSALPRNGPNGFVYDDVLNQVEVRGSACDLVKTSTLANPVKVVAKSAMAQ